MKTLFRVVALCSHHVPACAEIVAKTDLFARYRYGGEAAAQQLERALGDHRSDLAVTLDHGTDRVLGFGWVEREGAFSRSAYVRLIAIAPDTRSKGVGSALMRHFEARHLRPAGLLLLVTEDNRSARRFYERLGYRQVGAIEDYVVSGVTECIYHKPPPSG